MREFFKKFFGSRKREESASSVADRRAVLKQKVEAGTARALKEYGEVFRKLAEYDRS